MKNLMLLLLLAGCTSPDSPPAATLAEVAAADSVALQAVLGAPVAVIPTDGPFDGVWYRRYPGEPGLERLSIGHDTLGRYDINFGPTDSKSYYSIEAFTAYTGGDSLRIFGNPDHHSSAMGLHLGEGRQHIIVSHPITSLEHKPTARMVRDTFWLDSLRVRR